MQTQYICSDANFSRCYKQKSEFEKSASSSLHASQLLLWHETHSNKYFLLSFRLCWKLHRLCKKMQCCLNRRWGSKIGHSQNCSCRSQDDESQRFLLNAFIEREWKYRDMVLSNINEQFMLKMNMSPDLGLGLKTPREFPAKRTRQSCVGVLDDLISCSTRA